MRSLLLFHLFLTSFTFPVQSQKDTITIIGVGDIMLGTDYPSRIYLPPGDDCTPLLQPVHHILRDADITFGNFEGTLAGEKGTPKECRDTTMCFVFRMPQHYVSCIEDAGFDLLSIANNHANDFGMGGRKETQRVLESRGLAYAGALGIPSTVLVKEGIRYGLIAFAPNKGCYSIKDTGQAVSLIKEVRANCDILVVSVHGGAEGKDHQHMTRESEIYLGYDRGNIYKFAHLAVDAGADVVFGHGPHVTRAAEVYRDRFIIYSLGNFFCTYRRFNLRGPNGIAPIIKLKLSPDGRFLGGDVIPIYQPGQGGAKPDPLKRAIHKLRELTTADFPEVPLEIEENGKMRYNPADSVRYPGTTEKLADSALTDGQEVKVPETSVVIGTFLGNEQRNYYGNLAPDTLEVIWKQYLGKGETVISRKLGSREWEGAGWTGQPLLVEEVAVEGGKPELYIIQGAYDHNLKKIRASDGKLIWEYAFDDVIKGTGSLWENPDADDPEARLVILQGSRLGVGNYLDTKHIPSYRAISYASGKELWRLDVKWTDSYSRDVDGSALIIGDTAYLGLENSLFTVFSPDPKRASMKDGMLQPEIIQERKLYRNEDVIDHKYNIVTESSPSLLNNRIYVASGSGRVWGYNLDTRSLDWNFYIGSDMDGSAVVTSDGCIMVSVEKQYIAGPGGAMKLDPSKSPENAVVWYYPVADSNFNSWEGGIIGSIGMTDAYAEDTDKPEGSMDTINGSGAAACSPVGGRQYAAFVGIDGYLRVVEHTMVDESRNVLGPDGETLYHPPKGVFEKYVGPSISTPIFVGNRLIVAGYHGIRLFEFDSEGGFSQLDRLGPAFESTPVVHDGRIYIASRNGYLYCLGRKKFLF